MESEHQGTKLNNDDGVDRISDMPDSILCHILSFLPVKNAVAASILSTRWKTLFPLIWLPPIKLAIDDTTLLHPGQNSPDSCSVMFTDFVDKLLFETLSDVPSLQLLKLSCENDYGDDKIVSWVSAAVRLNVEELLLKVRLSDSETLFEALNGCESLTRLVLGKGFGLFPPDVFILPNLKKLVLDGIVFDEEEASFIEELINGCPALEVLCLSGCNLENTIEFVIQSPTLNTLIIEDCRINYICSLCIDAPNVEMLWYNDSAAMSYTVSDFKSLQQAHIDVGLTIEDDDDDYDEEEGPWFAEGVMKLVNACSRTTYLHLGASSIYALHRSPEQLPVFFNLTRLSLGCLGHGWVILAHLLSNSPNLEKLVIQEGFGEQEGGGYPSFRSLVQSPVCLERHLKEIEFVVFNEEDDEIKLVHYFLINGKVIESLKLSCLPLKDKTWPMNLPLRSEKVLYGPR